jgi:hypothetical protein
VYHEVTKTHEVHEDSLAGEYVWSGRTDTTGRASIPMTMAGQWLVRAVHMLRVEGDPKADWESFWASLNFELR